MIFNKFLKILDNSIIIQAFSISLMSLIVLGFNLILEGEAIKNIKPKHPFIQYKGRVDFSSEGFAQFNWPGTGFQLKVKTDSLHIVISDEKGDNFLNVFIDQNYDEPIIIDCEEGTKTYSIPLPQNEKPQLIELTKRTESQEGILSLQGVKLSGKETGRIYEIPQSEQSLKIEFYGDSQTAGYSIENPKDQGDPQFKNNALTYAAITARNLDADYSCIAVSGIGLKKSWVSGNMFDYYDQTLGTSPLTEKWNFSQWQADIVVINLGQNDFSLNAGDITQEYIRFTQLIREKYPEAKIILALGDMNSSQDSLTIQAQRNAIEMMNDPQVYRLTFQYGGMTHPDISRHAYMADQLEHFIQKILND